MLKTEAWYAQARAEEFVRSQYPEGDGPLDNFDKISDARYAISEEICMLREADQYLANLQVRLLKKT